MNDGFIISALSVIPKNDGAQWMGRFSRLRLPRLLHRALLEWYCNHYGVDLTECQGGVEDYANLAEFFIRSLKPGARVVDADPASLVSPCDGRVYAFGDIQQGKFEQSPGKPSSVQELLGCTPGEAARYEGGAYAVLYLSPRDYHRVHAPRESKLAGWRYRPGQLWPVFPAATRTVEELFARNERLLFRCQEAAAGEFWVAMIGAFGVGRMSSPHFPIITNTGGPADEQPLDRVVGRAEELGKFHMGSTVILVFEPGRVRWELAIGAPVQLGQRIGRVGATS